MIRQTLSDPATGRPSGGPSSSSSSRYRSRGPLALFIWCFCALLLFAGFCALGVWQVERRAWKLDLIQKVDERAHAPPVAAPGPDRWASVSREGDEYRHVRVTGTFLADKVTLVATGTRLGTGYWVMTPLQRADGSVVLINRGFVSQDDSQAAQAGQRTPGGTVTVQGLLRLSQPGGGALRDNVPAENRWYSRDVKAMAAARGLPPQQVAPYFIDAGMPPAVPPAVVAPGAADSWPVNGLTVIHFRNSHLGYAITWFSLALLVLLCTAYVIHVERLRRTR